MQLPRYEFEPMDGYVNPDIDPLDPKSLENKEQIPKRIIDALTKEFNGLKWYGKVVKRTKELAEQKMNQHARGLDRGKKQGGPEYGADQSAEIQAHADAK